MKMFDMLTNEDLKRIKKEPDSKIKELENSLSIALEINDKFQRDNAALIKSRPLNTMDEVAYRELQAENEKLATKCIEAGSAMIELNMKYEANIKKVGELKSDLARAKEDHQYDNLVHQKELESLRKK